MSTEHFNPEFELEEVPAMPDTQNQHTAEHEHETLKDEAFKSQEMAMVKIGQSLQQFVDDLAARDKEVIFGERQAELCACCIDERVRATSVQELGFRAAGAGILLGKEQAQQLWHELGIVKVLAHKGCGAAKLYCQEQGIDTDNTDQIAADVLKAWADEAGLQFGWAEMADYEFHPARMAIVSTGRFNQSSVTPQAFAITPNMSAANIVDDAKLSWAIAAGDHGLADRFTTQNPFVIATIVPAEQQQLANEVEQLLTQDDWLASQDGRVVLQKATQPSLSQSEAISNAAD
jgi:hypothetical protein